MKLTQETLLGFIQEEMDKTNELKSAQPKPGLFSILSKRWASSIDSTYESLVEDLNEIEPINEADGPSKIMQWMWWGPKAKKAQKKVNKVKLNIVALEFARDEESHAGAKKKLENKVKTAKEQKKSLQSMVDDKFKDKGSITTRYLASEKIKGQLEAIKATTGMSNDPNRNKGLKDKMKELNQKYKEEQEAINATEPSTEEKKEAQEKIDKEIAKNKGKETTTTEENPNKAKIEAQETANGKLETAYTTANTAWTDHKGTDKPEEEAALLAWNKKEETLRQAKMKANVAKLQGELKLATIKDDKAKITSVNKLITDTNTALNNKESFPALNSVGTAPPAGEEEVDPEDGEAAARAEAERLDKEEADKAADMAAGKEEQGDDPNAPKKKEDETTDDDPQDGEAAARAEAEAADKAEADKAADMAAGKEEQGDDPSAKDAKLKSAKDALAAAEKTGDEEAIAKAKKAITDIGAKENWQLDGTRLGGMLDARVSKIKSDAVLTESKYQSQSIKDRLSRLL